jgi:RNA polymerase Rpb8.
VSFVTDVLVLAETNVYIFRAVFVSFGGLLLYLEGPYKKLAPLRIDHVYLLLKK